MFKADAAVNANNSSQQPPNWATRISLRNSVPERGFSCTESTRGTVEGLLRYATCFLRHSVLKIGFYGTEAIFGVVREAAKRHRSAPPEHNNHQAAERQQCTKRPPGKNNTGPQINHQGTRGAATIYSSRLQPSQCVTAETLTCYSSKRLFSRA